MINCLHTLIIIVGVLNFAIAKTEMIKHIVTMHPNSSLLFLISSSHDSSYIAVQEQGAQNDFSGLISAFKVPYRVNSTICELLPSQDVLVGYFENENSYVAIIYTANGQLTIFPVQSYQSRSCYEYANPITRTFDQLNVRRCMRVGGDLIVCGKIITDPVCNVTPCATQIER